MAFLEQLTGSIGTCLTPLKPPCGRKACCNNQQELASELQTRQTELQRTNEELAEKRGNWPSKTPKSNARIHGN